MTRTVRTLVFSGSSRAGSYNRRLAARAAAAAREQGAEVTELDLRELGLPVYDGDIEAAGLPAGALTLRQLFATHEAVLIAAPEYNGFVTPLLLNSLDWTSRVPKSDGLPDGLSALNGTVAGLMSASPGGYGGMRGLIALRSLLAMNIGMLIVPQTLAVAKAGEAFDAEGRFVDARQQASLEKVVAATLSTAAALQPR